MSSIPSISGILKPSFSEEYCRWTDREQRPLSERSMGLENPQHLCGHPFEIKRANKGRFPGIIDRLNSIGKLSAARRKKNRQKKRRPRGYRFRFGSHRLYFVFFLSSVPNESTRHPQNSMAPWSSRSQWKAVGAFAGRANGRSPKPMQRRMAPRFIQEKKKVKVPENDNDDEIETGFFLSGRIH